jgi:hypothetical protein
VVQLNRVTMCVGHSGWCGVGCPDDRARFYFSALADKLM